MSRLLLAAMLCVLAVPGSAMRIRPSDEGLGVDGQFSLAADANVSSSQPLAERGIVSESGSAADAGSRSNGTFPCTHSVVFKLNKMHSFFTIPKCVDHGRCQACQYFDVHWNVDGCLTHLCVWPAQKYPDGRIIGPQEGIPMHPLVAWGILEQLKQVYRFPYREAGFSGPLSAFGMDAVNPVKLGMVIGQAIRDVNEVPELAANQVNWDRRLGTSCWWTRSRTQIMQKDEPTYNKKTHETKYHTISAVCWNIVIDFRDMYCRWKKKIDMTDPAQYSTIVSWTPR